MILEMIKKKSQRCRQRKIYPIDGGKISFFFCLLFARVLVRMSTRQMHSVTVFEGIADEGHITPGK